MEEEPKNMLAKLEDEKDKAENLEEELKLKMLI